jgi:hypothetical protein
MYSPHRPQLGLGDPAADAGHQPGAAAAALTQMKSMLKMQRVAAADQGHSGKIQEVQPARSAQSRDEPGDFGAL